jgi:cobalt-zinc-cadmium efflux system outer membrane protein
MQQAFYAQTLLDVAQAEAQLQSDREKLNRLMGVWGADTNWRAPTRLPAIPETLPSLDKLETRAIEGRLDLAAAKKDAEAAAQALNLTKQFRYLGPLGIGVAYKREPDLGKFWGPTVELGIPIFNQRQADVARAEADFKRTQERVAALAVDIRSQARESRVRLVAASSVVHHYEAVLLPLQQTIVGETLKLYNGMLVGVYELLLAQQNQVQTAREYVAASKSFWLAWTDVERAIGTQLPIAQTSAHDAEQSENTAAPPPADSSANHSSHLGDTKP